MNTGRKVDVSVIITVSETHDDCAGIHEEVSSLLRRLHRTYEFIFVEYTDSAASRTRINELKARFPEEIKLVTLRSVFSESDALAAGFAQAAGAVILILPVYYQVQPHELDKLIQPLEKEYDLMAARRINRTDAPLNRIESAIFNNLVRRLIGVEIHDLGCGVLAMRKEVAESLDMYGDMFRFIPVLAHRQGYKIGEADIQYLARRKKSGLYSAGVYLRRLLDIITLFFIVKFTKKPLRFFGMTGAAIFILGTCTNLYLTYERFMGKALADRPMLILGTLFMVLGVQLVSIGLIGELIIFIYAKNIKEYRIEKIA